LPIFTHQLELIEHKYYDELLMVIDDTNKDETNQLIEKLDSKIIDIINEKKAGEPIFDGYTKIKYKNIIRMKDTSSIIKLKVDHNTIFRKRTNIDDINYLANHPTIAIPKTELDIGNIYRCIIQISSIWISENVFGVYMRPLIIEKLELMTIDFQETSKKPTYNNPLSSEDKIVSNNLNEEDNNDNEIKPEPIVSAIQDNKIPIVINQKIINFSEDVESEDISPLESLIGDISDSSV
jgi:hypothetical protein